MFARMKKVIFDTDIGIDDAMALLFLHHSPEVELVLLVSNAGIPRAWLGFELCPFVVAT